MNSQDWSMLAGQQLSLDLPDMIQRSPPGPREEFMRAKNAEDLLRQLARTLGELRATIDLEELQSSLVMPPEPSTTA